MEKSATPGEGTFAKCDMSHNNTNVIDHINKCHFRC